MPKSTTARFGSDIVTVEKALEIRGTEKRAKSQANFFCGECGKAVRPHREGGGAAAHFEHLALNPQCSLSHEKKSVTSGRSQPPLALLFPDKSEFTSQVGGGQLPTLGIVPHYE